MSASVLRLLQDGEGRLKATKFAWQRSGEEKFVGLANLQARVLCTAHNAALSPYDSLAERFCSTIFHAGPRAKTTVDASALFNGEDVEGWLLKMLCGTIAMERRALDRKNPWHAPVDWLNTLFRVDAREQATPRLWIDRGEHFEPFKKVGFSITPIDGQGDPPLGLKFHFCGVKFVLLMHRDGKRQALRDGLLRPGSLTFNSLDRTHKATVAMRFRSSPTGLALEI